MTPSSHLDHHRPAGARALLGYVLGWIALGAAVAGAAIAILHDDRPQVALPPIEQTELEAAADRGGCRLRRGGQDGAIRPRVEGPRGRPVAAGTYRTQRSQGGLIAAMRRGAVLILYRPGTPENDVDRLIEMQEALPGATIVAPQAGMRYPLAATAWRRLLGCRELGDESMDAIRLFRGRYVGQGPDTTR